MAKKINISLVGGQPLPVYIPIINERPDVVYLLHSGQTKRQAGYIKRLLATKMPTTAVVMVPLDTNLDTAARQLRASAGVWCKGDCTATVNVSGGTKGWSIICSNVFGGIDNATVIYIDQNNVVWDIKSSTHSMADASELSLDDYASLFGLECKKTDFSATYTDADRQAAQQLNELHSKNAKALGEMAGYLSDHTNETSTSHNSCSLAWDKAERCFTGFITDYKGLNPQEFTIGSPNCRRLMLNTGWFEFLVADLLSSWPQARNVWTNVHFYNPKGSFPNDINSTKNKNNAESDLNEVDIIVETTKGKLLYVECKTQVHNTTDIDKFNTVVKKTGGLGSKLIFVTKKPIDGVALKNIENQGIRRFVYRDIESNKSKFFDELYKYLDSINEK